MKNRGITLIGFFFPITFVFLNLVILGHQINIIEIMMAFFVTFYALSVYNKNKDYLDPRIYYPILYFLLFWLGDFDFYKYEIVPNKIWIHYLIGLCGYFFGSEISQKFSKVKKGEKLRDRIGENARRIIIIFYIFASLAKLLMFYKNGIPLFASNVDASRQTMSESFGIVKAIAYGLYVIPVFAFYDIISRNKNKLRFRISDFLIISCSLGFAILDVSRLLIIEMVIPMLLIYILKVKRISLKTLGILILCVLIYIGINQIFRNQRLNSNYLTYISNSRETNMFENVMISSLNNFRVGIDDYYKVTEIVPSKSGYTYGMLFFNSLISPLPGKQITIGFYVADLLGMSFDGIGAATTILGMFYIDGGFFLIFVGMFLFGAFVQYFYKAYIMNNTISIYHLVPVYILFYAINTLRTNVLPNIEPVMAIFYYWFFGYIIKKT